MQFVTTKLLSSDYFEISNLEIDWFKIGILNYAIGREVVGGLRKMVIE